MQSIVMFGTSFVMWIRSLIGIVLPMFADAADFRSWPKWFKLLVHAIILAVIFYGLWYLNKQPFIQNLLKSKATNAVKEIYLPLIFLLLYVISWLGYFWWKLFNRGDAAEFPDIESAWDSAMRKLAQSGYRLGDAPLYLILGKPSAGDDALFLASGQRIEVRAPLAVDSPIRIFAGPDAIFVCCSGASTWGAYADALANPEMSGALDAPAAGAGATITPGQALQGVDEKIQDEFYRLLQLQSDRPLTPEEDARLRELGEQIQSSKSGGGTRRVALSNEVLGLGPRRLAFLCKLIARDRRPWCPLNGAMVLIPWAALETDEICRNALGVLATDLAVARATFRQRYAHFLMVCDLEQSPGFDEFRRGFPKDMLKQRIGQRLPLIPDRPPEEVPAVMEQAADWIRMNVLAQWVIKYLRLEWPPDPRSAGSFIPPHNQKLFGFLHEMFVRGPRLGRLMARGLPVESTAVAGDNLAALPLVAGCYLAATGRDEKHQAFVAGVFQRLTESQSAVGWSAEAMVEDRSNSQWAGLLYVAALLLLAIIGGVVYLQFFKDLKTG
jgi:type VI protein secretion system component VasK